MQTPDSVGGVLGGDRGSLGCHTYDSEPEGIVIGLIVSNSVLYGRMSLPICGHWGLGMFWLSRVLVS